MAAFVGGRSDSYEAPPLLNRITGHWQRALTVLRAPRVRIELYGSTAARGAYEAFTARHPKFKVTQRTRWGVALIPLPKSFDEYLAGAHMKNLRYERRRALKAGYSFAVVSPQRHLDEFFEINESTPVRQGRPMEESYVDREQVRRTIGSSSALSAILDATGHVRAYANVVDAGDAIILSTILGHADHLKHGIMYLLVSEVIRRQVEDQAATQSARWVMYDTFWGASPGLAFFKDRVGFRPFTVRWVWRD